MFEPPCVLVFFLAMITSGAGRFANRPYV
jgi:hypothetical protein